MDITEFSFFMTIIWSSMAILFLFLICKKRRFIKYFGITSLMTIYIACFLRLVLPVEVPFVKVFVVNNIIADIYELLFLERFSVIGFQLTIMNIFLGIWFSGILVCSIVWVIQYIKTVKKLDMLKKNQSKQEEKVFVEVKNSYRKKLHVEVWKSPQVEIPFGIGILKKKIFLPETTYNEEELYYVLLHEYTHFMNGDTMVKMLVQILCCVFWWNPCIYLLKKDLDQTLEIKCDLTVTKYMDKSSRISYLEVIISTIKSSWDKTEKEQKVPLAALVKSGANKAIVERFQVVTDSIITSRKTKFTYYVLLFLLCGLMAGSYLFQFQPKFEVPVEELSPEEEMTPQNTYLLDNGDGTYTIIDVLERAEDQIFSDRELAKDMITEGFVVEKERRKK